MAPIMARNSVQKYVMSYSGSKKTLFGAHVNAQNQDWSKKPIYVEL